MCNITVYRGFIVYLDKTPENCNILFRFVFVFLEKTLKSITKIPTIVCNVRGGSFVLRPFYVHDEASLVEHINSSHIADRVSNVPSPYTTEHAREWLEHMRMNSLALSVGEKTKRLDFAITVLDEVIGSVALIEIKGHMGQLSYWLSRDFQGKGIMTAAVRAVVDWGLNECGFVRVWGYTWSDNTASQAVLEGAGLKLEGIHRKVWPKNGEFYDSHMYAIVV